MADAVPFADSLSGPLCKQGHYLGMKGEKENTSGWLPGN